MKILFLSEWFPEKENGKITGGVETRVLFTAQELVKMGHDVAVVTSKFPNSANFETWSTGLKIYRVGPERSYTQAGQVISRLVFTLAALWESFFIKYDVIDAGNAVVYFVASISAFLKNKRSVHWVPDIVGFRDWLRPQGLIGAIIATILEKTIRLIPASTIIALSQTTKSKLIKMGAEENRMVVVYPGVKESVYLKIIPKIFTAISVSRLVIQKRVDLVIEVINGIKNIKYVVIGDGTEKEKLMAMSSKTKFLGNISNEKVLENFSKSSVFLLASEVEGFGIVTLEAMSCGLPFINSDIPVHQEIEKISRGGLLFKSGDAKDLKEKVQLLMHDEKLYQKLATNALKFAKKHTWKFAAIETLKVYNDLYEA